MLSSVTRELPQAGLVARSRCGQTRNISAGRCGCGTGTGDAVLSVNNMMLWDGAAEFSEVHRVPGARRPAGTHSAPSRPRLCGRGTAGTRQPHVRQVTSKVSPEHGSQQQTQYLCGTLQMLHHDTPSVSTATHNARSPKRFRNVGASCYHPPAANHVQEMVNSCSSVARSIGVVEEPLQGFCDTFGIL